MIPRDAWCVKRMAAAFAACVAASGTAIDSTGAESQVREGSW
jgi:hypothetical protein